MSPARRPGATAPGLYLQLVLTVYVLSAALLPLAHHDIVCHIKSSTHCTTCVVGSAAEHAAGPASTSASALVDAGTAGCNTGRPAHSAARASADGRAPPARS